ncbi:MAG: 2'-5' RNA ligase family protein [Chloroflexi bacterium]|nr:2'-5' RNA ligase family protein [Chloroflexota bacterium]
MNAADYDRFAVVVFAPPPVRDQVEAIRRQLPPSGRPIMAAHVTVKGTFVQPTDLAAVVARIQRCCQSARPCTLTTGEVVANQTDEYAGIALAINAVETVTDLHWALVAALTDLGQTVYAPEIAGRFAPHLTLVEQIPASSLEGALTIIRRRQPQFTFAADEITLAGRRGGLVWEPLHTVALGIA